MTLPILKVPLVYGSLYSSPSEFEACAQPPDPGWLKSQDCKSDFFNGIIMQPAAGRNMIIMRREL